MNQVFKNFPYYIPFTFTSVDDDNRFTSMQPVPYDVAVYGITITPSRSPQSAYYQAGLQFQNYNTGDTLFDESLFNFNLQSDARTYIKLPSKWFIKKNDKIICSLNSEDDVASTTYYITLLAHLVDADPNPGVQPFVYSFPIKIGFQDNVGGTTTGPAFNQGFTGTLAKHMLHDFEIHSLVFNSSAFGGVDTIPSISFQLSTQRRKLFDRFIIDGCAGGGNAYQQGDTFNWMATLANLHAFPEDSFLQWYLPMPEMVRKGELVRVDVSPAPTYLSTDDIHTNLTEIACMALIGNHIA